MFFKKYNLRNNQNKTHMGLTSVNNLKQSIAQWCFHKIQMCHRELFSFTSIISEQWPSLVLKLYKNSEMQAIDPHIQEFSCWQIYDSSY